MNIFARAMLGAVVAGTSLAPAQAPVPVVSPATAPVREPVVPSAEQRIQDIAAARRMGQLTTENVQELVELLRQLDATDPKQLSAFASLGYLLGQIADDVGREGSGASVGLDQDTLINRAVEAYLRAGALAHQMGDEAAAEQIYSRILVYRRDNAEAVLGLARAYANTDRTYQAIDRYREYLESTKIDTVRDPEAYLELAGIYTRATSYQQAIRALEQAAKRSPSNPAVYSQMADVLAKQGKLDEALQAITKARDLAPADPAHTAGLAMLLLARQQTQQALQAAREAMKKAQDQLMREPEKRSHLEALIGGYEVYLRILNEVLKTDDKNLAIRMELVSGMQRRAAALQVLHLHEALEMLKATPQLVDLQAALDGKLPNALSPAELATEQNLALLRELASLQVSVADKDLPRTCEQIRRLDPDNRILKLPPDSPLARQIYGGGPPAAAP